MSAEKGVVPRALLQRTGVADKLALPGVTEVMVNRPGEIWIEDKDGFSRFDAPEANLDALRNLANALCIYNNKKLDYVEPMHSVTLPDGERGHIVIAPACDQGLVVMTFRKPSPVRLSIADYEKSGRLSGFRDLSLAMSKQAGSAQIDEGALEPWQLEMIADKNEGRLSDFFQKAVDHKCNICMVGGTGSGKTTFSKALADLIDANTRIITIEDTHELSLPYHPNHVHLYHREGVTAKQALASCMRMKPDRIFLTELRGDEAWDYLSALNTGHQGGLTSVHANDCVSAFYRIAQLAKESETGKTMDYAYILGIVRSTIDVVCFFKRTFLTEIYYNPIDKLRASAGRAMGAN